MRASWVDVVGFDIERLHTGALRTLLEDSSHAPAVLGALGLPNVHLTDGPWLERRTGSGTGRRKPDLTAELTNGQLLVVETKVDSPVREGQLKAEATGDRFHGVVPCLGFVRFQTFDCPPGWRRLELEVWDDMLNDLKSLSPPLDDYRRRIAEEVELHREARLWAQSQADALPSSDDRLRDLYLWAWLDEVGKAIEGAVPTRPRVFRNDLPRTGPVLFWADSWVGTDRPELAHTGYFVGINIDRRTGARTLGLAGGARDPALREPLRQAIVDRLEPAGLEPVLRRPRKDHDNFAIGRRDLEGPASQAVGHLLAAFEVYRGDGQQLVESLAPLPQRGGR